MQTGELMASRTTLNARNLEALGAEHLAEVLIDISTGNAAIKRKLRLILAGAQSPKEAAREINKRLTSIARAKSYIDWQKQKALVDDLETQRRAIMEQVALRDPTEALSLLWRFMGLATPVLNRCDDSSGEVSNLFYDASEYLGQVAEQAQTDPRALAESTFNALHDNDYCQYDGLIARMSPALGEDGLAHLKARVEEFGKTPVSALTGENRRAGGRVVTGITHAQERLERKRQSIVTTALKDIADAQGDVDSFIAQYEPETHKRPETAAAIARRLLAKGRAPEALEFIEGADLSRDRGRYHAWEHVRVEALEAIGRSEEAQAFRYECFERHLSIGHLREYLKRLPDFDDMEAEEQAMDHAMAYRGLLTALNFFLKWPALDRASELLITRHGEINGDHFSYLTPAAEALAERHPLAATLALRAMIDFTLTTGRSRRYRHAARHLGNCARLAPEIEDFGDFETHDAYFAGIKTRHGRKHSFWLYMKDEDGAA